MSSSITEVPDIEDLALRAREMLERVTGQTGTGTSHTTTTAALRNAVSTTTDTETDEDLDLYSDPIFENPSDATDETKEDERKEDEVLEAELAEDTELGETEPAGTEQEQSTRVADALGQEDGHVLDTAQHDSAKRRLGILANRAKDSLRAAQEEAKRAEELEAAASNPQEVETEDTRRATAAVFGSDEEAEVEEETATSDTKDDADGWISHYDPEASTNATSSVDETDLLFGDQSIDTDDDTALESDADTTLQTEDTEVEEQIAQTRALLYEPLSIDRSEIDFPAITGSTSSADNTAEADTNEDVRDEQSTDGQLDPQVAIFAPPEDVEPETREPSDTRLESQFSPIDPAADEVDLAPILSDDDKRDGRAAAAAAAVFLVVAVGGFALLSVLSGDDAGTDLASEEPAQEDVIDEPDETASDSTEAIDESAAEPPAAVDPVPEADDAADDDGTEVLGQVEESETATTTAPEPQLTTWAVLLDTNEVSEFVAISESAGLQSLLDDAEGAGEDYTVFAPSNDAIASLPAERLEALLNDPTEAEAFVSDHLIVGRQTPAVLSESAGQAFAARSGTPVLVREIDGRILLNGSVALTDGGPAGVDAPIFVIDAPLEAPTVNQILDLENIQFEVISATITESGQGELDRVVEYLDTLPDAQILIEGHTDTDGEADPNLALSQRRADAVLEYLVANGIDEGRLEAIGLGETEPVLANGVEDKDASRRIELVLQ